MPRVLRIINRFNLGGITYNVSYLSKYLPETYETLLIGGPEEPGEQSSLFIPQSLGLQPQVIEEMRRSVNPLSDYFAYKKIKKIIKEFKPDIVHTHASKAGAIGRLAALSAGVPVIVHTFHGHVFSGYFGTFKTSIFKTIERFLAKKSTAIVTISALQKKEICEQHKICAGSKAVVIPLGFDLVRFTEQQEQKRNVFRKRFNLENSSLAIGIIGRLAPIKNHYLFIDAINELVSKTTRSVKAIIIGDGETRASLELYIQSLPLKTQQCIIFAGWITEVDVALAGLDLVCLSSKNEGTPVSLIEAQAAGRFVVSTNVGGIKDILHPACGLLSEPSDAQGFIANLADAVTNFERYAAKAGSAQAEVLQKYSYARLCTDMDNLYKDLLAKP